MCAGLHVLRQSLHVYVSEICSKTRTPRFRHWQCGSYDLRVELLGVNGVLVSSQLAGLRCWPVSAVST